MTTKTEFRATTDLTDLEAAPPAFGEAVLGNTTTSIQINFDPKDNGHTLLFGKTRDMGRQSDDDSTGGDA
ncbi:MAG: hypothetical protein GAK28_04336 [Luteibacter sp.]|uniref:hypothetical protein n=1 Tax=Luteibacter sp. TaxID=1886636 RepID=UPI001383E857|nr:hypothetical protein [Luteibacter sp.]KAF1003873.1 MAG: hypothetical protein GAK28_04336 [Luteibacter sp.]